MGMFPDATELHIHGGKFTEINGTLTVHNGNVATMKNLPVGTAQAPVPTGGLAAAPFSPEVIQQFSAMKALRDSGAMEQIRAQHEGTGSEVARVEKKPVEGAQMTMKIGGEDVDFGAVLKGGGESGFISPGIVIQIGLLTSPTCWSI